MLLSELFENQPAIEIERIMYDSRDKLANSIFFSLTGLTSDGHKFISQAIQNGAIAIVHSKELEAYEENIVYIKVDSVEEIFPDIVSKFYQNPSDKLWLFGVTGTNGKSTVALIIKNLFNHLKPTGYIGTVGMDYNQTLNTTSYTTSDLVSNSEMLVKMIKDDIEAISMEISSQGLEQNRVAGMKFDVAIFTNLTHDHLDFHMNMENYYQAKKKLFTSLEYDNIAIINIDDEYGSRLNRELVIPSLTVSFNTEATYRITNVKLSADKSSFDLIFENHKYSITTSLLGRFNIMNLVQAIAAVHASGMELSDILLHLDTIETIPGRMDNIKENQDFSVIVDYAHTPDGFEKIMSFARNVTNKNNRIIAVFGSPGKRDKSKRIIFGTLVEKYCDLAILTEDDNRDERVYDIAVEIAKGILTKPYVIVEYRYEAIRQALTIARPGDTVLLLAKGNELFIAREFENEPYMGDKSAAIEILNKLRKEIEEYEKLE